MQVRRGQGGWEASHILETSCCSLCRVVDRGADQGHEESQEGVRKLRRDGEPCLWRSLEGEMVTDFSRLYARRGPASDASLVRRIKVSPRCVRGLSTWERGGFLSLAVI